MIKKLKLYVQDSLRDQEIVNKINEIINHINAKEETERKIELFEQERNK